MRIVRFCTPVLLAACAAQPSGSQTQTTPAESLLRFERAPIGIRLAQGDMHCGKSSSADYGNCSDIPVIVLELGGNCQALVPYANLIAHHGNGATVVRWVLHPSKGYKFVDDGIAFDPNETSGGHYYSDIYDGKVNGGDTFQWVIKPNAYSPTTFHHVATVQRDNGTPCGQADPTITNQN